MKYILTEEQVDKNFERLFNKLLPTFFSFYPSLEGGLRMKTSWGNARNDYGEYRYSSEKYMDNEQVIWLESDGVPSSDTAWWLNPELESFFNLVGEDIFVKFINKFFGVNILDKYGKENDWFFS